MGGGTRLKLLLDTHIFLWSVAAYGGATIVFGLSRSFLLTFLALAAHLPAQARRPAPSADC